MLFSFISYATYFVHLFFEEYADKVTECTGSVRLGWQKVWATSHAQPKWWVIRYQIKKKTTCWSRERAAMGMIDCRPQMYTWLFLHQLRGVFKSSTTCVEHSPFTFNQDCSLLKWTQPSEFFFCSVLRSFPLHYTQSVEENE